MRESLFVPRISKIGVFSFGLVLGIGAFCASQLLAQEAKRDWKTVWEKVLAAARKEGEVAVAGPQGSTHREALTTGFKSAYPEIRVNFVGARSVEVAARIRQEREAGLFLWDVFIGGPTTSAQILKPLGALAPLRPELVLPEVLSDNLWVDGFENGWMDTEAMLVYAFGGSVSGSRLYVNRNIIPASELSSARQLLEPKFAGKIMMDDPRQDGNGLSTAFAFLIGYGEEFLRKLFSQQTIIYSRDRRQQIEWMVRGRYPIGIGVSSTEIVLYQADGLGKNLMAVETPDLPEGEGTGNDSISLFTRAPHPNAAIVYINHLLSKGGQEQWSKLGGRNSRRTDVSQPDPKNVLQPGRKYIKMQLEKWVGAREKVKQLARELIP
jgi:ABC-type Fe3+ transport system substrate-binding protein